MSNGKRHFLDLFFYPGSVAIVGASRNPNSFNFHLVSNLVKLKFQGKIYPVNPNPEEITGLKAYPDLKSIEGDIDLAVIAVPAGKTLDIVRDCVAKRVKSIAIITGGFSETGIKGKGVQDEILSLLKESGIRATGPNALSPINTRNNFIIGSGATEKLPKGQLSFIFQSGLYQPRLNWLLSDFHLYLSKLIDLGNKMDINEVDALEYLAQDPETKVIAMHLESVAGDGQKFMQLLKDTTKEKPVIVLKSGRTAAGAKAASSHTGALMRSSDTIFDVALKQSGAIRVQGLDEFFDLAKIFEYLPPMKKNRIAIGTQSGGEGVIATDLCQLNGLTLAKLSPETHSKLRSIFPPWDIPTNPFDINVCSQFNREVNVHSVFLDTLVDDPNVDCFAMSIMSGSSRTGQNPFVKSSSEVIKRGKHIITWTIDPIGGGEMIKQLESNRIPVFLSPERAIKALAAFYQYHSNKVSGT
ncbi:acetate--CoA ligase family protein [Chloroflexota bacterium]